MAERFSAKNKAKTAILEYPNKVLVDTSTYETNHRPQFKSQLQSLIQKSTQAYSKLYVEIGMGDGEFTNELARRNPDALCIGVELKEERILNAVSETKKDNLENTLFLRISAAHLDEVLLEQQIDTIFMNFPDPWPKKKHVKHRMTTPKFLSIYSKLLTQDGHFVFKTDNQIMYEYTLEMLHESDLTVLSTETDLAHDENNIMTRFESRYRTQEKNIHKIIAKK